MARNTKQSTETARGAGNWQGMNWIRQDKRLAIYLRDGLACVYCAASVEDGAQLTLDHQVPHSKGGKNIHTNLATACSRCNPSRGNRSVKAFVEAVSQYVNHGVTAHDIMAHIKTTTKRDLKPFLAQARALIAQRGSAAKALQK